MVSIKTVAAVLFAVNWLYLSSSSNDECRINLDGGQDLNMIIPVEITCATFLSGTLVTWWTIREEDDDYVELVTLNYNCTGFGQDMANHLHVLITGPRHGEVQSDRVDLRPSPSSNYSFLSTDPTCYIDGCFVWNSGRDVGVTWAIPTVTCNSTVTMSSDVAGLTETPLPISTTSVYHNIHNINKLDIDSSAILSSMVTETSTSTTTSTADFTKTSGGLRSYLWFLLLLVPVVATGLFVPLLILWIIRRKRRIRRHNVMHSSSSSLKLNDNNNDNIITIKTINKTE